VVPTPQRSQAVSWAFVHWRHVGPSPEPSVRRVGGTDGWLQRATRRATRRDGQSYQMIWSFGSHPRARRDRTQAKGARSRWARGAALASPTGTTRASRVKKTSLARDPSRSARRAGPLQLSTQSRPYSRTAMDSGLSVLRRRSYGTQSAASALSLAQCSSLPSLPSRRRFRPDVASVQTVSLQAMPPI
jgi:hypothetical protein